LTPQRSIGGVTKRTPIILAIAAGTAVLTGVGLAAGYVLADAEPEQYVTVTSCDHDSGETRVGFEVKNATTSPKSFDLRFRVLDARGKELSTDVEHVRTTDPGATREDSIYLKYASGTGAGCEFVGEE
jgi:hypothetical protein